MVRQTIRHLRRRNPRSLREPRVPEVVQLPPQDRSPRDEDERLIGRKPQRFVRGKEGALGLLFRGQNVHQHGVEPVARVGPRLLWTVIAPAMSESRRAVSTLFGA